MGKLVVDLQNYKDRMGARVPEGRYRVQVEDLEETRSKAGNPMVNLFFRIVGGEYDGQTLVDRLTVTDKAMFRVVAFLQALGMPTPRKRIQVDTNKFLGRTLDVDVEDGEPYNGRVRSEVRGYIKVAQAAKATEVDELEDVSEAEEEVGSPQEEKPKPAAKSAPESNADSTQDVDLDDVEL